ncbi:MAG: hypothetical protein Q9180_008895, partial [Flavoplaca navasiana]
AIRRKSLSPYTFRSGTPHIPTGTITSVSSYNLMHDAHFYPDPNRFDGLRYTRKTMPYGECGMGGQGQAKGGNETENPIPGRYHAALVLKLCIIHLVRNYDFQLAEP